MDARIVQEVRSQQGKFINAQNDVGGYPEYRSSPSPEDKDNDGMPDDWERKRGFSSQDAHDRNLDPDQDGYTNLEEFLNETDPRKKDR